MHNKSLGINDDDLQNIINVLSRTPLVESAKVYGSRAKGTYKPGSDIDLTIQLKNGVQPDLFLYTLVANALDDLNLIDLTARHPPA